jgi:transketolase
MFTLEELYEKAHLLRKDTLEMCIDAKTGHLTSSLSVIEILISLYYGGIMNHDPKDPEWKDRDRHIYSKGQGSPALYNLLADCGYYDKSWTERFAQVDGPFGVHLQKTVPGIEISTGSLGHGIGVATGLALAAKIKRELWLTFCTMGDGEMYEGSVWETAMFAAHHNLNNLVVLVDRNYLCTTDFTENLIKLEPLVDKWVSFGWAVRRINGHDIGEIIAACSDLRQRKEDRPMIILCDTIKGAGIPHVENKPIWHAAAPTKQDDIDMCRKELGINTEPEGEPSGHPGKTQWTEEDGDKGILPNE